MKRKEFSDKAQFFYGFIRSIAPKGLLQMNGPDWKVHRHALEPAIAKEAIESHFHVFSEVADNFSKSFPRHAFDVHKALAPPLVGIFMRVSMLGEELGPADEQRLRSAAQMLDETLEAVNTRSFQPLLWPDFVYSRTPMGRRINRGLSDIREFVDAAIVQRRLQAVRDAEEAALGRGVARKQIMLDKMLQSDAFSNQDIMDEFFTFLSASNDTTTTSLSLIFKMMSISPEIQDRVRAEVDQVLGVGADARSVELQDLPRLQYVEQVIKETQRIVPSTPFLARQVYQQTELAGKTIPANSTLIVNVHGAHHDPVHWPDPWRYDPERFAPGKQHHPCAFIPFSAGPRRCPAGFFAMMAMKTIFASVIRDYVIEPVDDGVREAKDLKLTFNLTARIIGGTFVNFRPRTTLAG
ncbi:cytochrome P450 4V2-like [Thrips palmi]|uniref:Cytochrome P450 4V2-like n=1 Tax=Thrips palmi TaxID=161013 RepID=A0A6P8ZZR0_THRPL|nr:cytochrome P450 4V2-like [Thrips palmi]